MALSNAGLVPGAFCGNPMLRSIELKTCRSLLRRTALVFQVIAIEIEWLPDNHVLMTGPVATSFAGTLDRSLLA